MRFACTTRTWCKSRRWRLLATATNCPTRDRLPFAKVSKKDIEHFTSILGPEGVVTDARELAGYNQDWLHHYKGHAPAALRPKSTDEVSSILTYCNNKNLALVPQSGNTGLVGGSIPVYDEIVLSLARMNQVIDFDPLSGTLQCQSGCVLENLDIWLRERGHMMPLDLGAKGSCMIGGNVSTNAGGLRLVRYGTLHGTVLGLEVVLADGTILDTMSTLRKDNTGPDLKHLFIGSEGTLGVVTKVAIQTPHAPAATNLAFLGVDDYAAVLRTFTAAKKHLGEIISAVEFLDRRALEIIIERGDDMHPDPLGSSAYPFYVMIETAGSDHNHDYAKLEKFFDAEMSSGTIVDGVVAQDSAQQRKLWAMREFVAEAHLRMGHLYSYDVSIPLPVLYDAVELMRKEFRGDPDVTVTGFGHLGDGNLHLNLTVPSYRPDVEPRAEAILWPWLQANGGSISAEHGLGQHKADFIGYSKSASAIGCMHKLKRLFDPRGILNPYKTLPALE